MKRYYFNRNPDAQYKIQDRELGEVIAICRYREQAVLVEKALNELYERGITQVPAGEISK